VPAGGKAGLLDLVGHAAERGWAVRRASEFLGLDHARYHHWAIRRDAGRLEDAAPGGHPLHGLLAWERAAVAGLFEAWGEIDRSHRKLAHRGSRIGLVHVSEPAVRRVLGEEGLVLEGPPPREPLPRAPWPDWLEWKPNRVWAYDFTHWTRARRASIAILDVVSRKWLATLTSAEETSTQAGACFLAALEAENLLEAADQLATAALREAIASGETGKVQAIAGDGQIPLLLTISDNGPQMRSVSTREFLAGDRPAVRPPAHPPGPGVDRDAVRPRQGRVAAPGEDPRPRRARHRARQGAPGIQRSAPARLDRLRHPRRRTRRQR
jgi:putative transposase